MLREIREIAHGCLKEEYVREREGRVLRGERAWLSEEQQVAGMAGAEWGKGRVRKYPRDGCGVS